MFRIIVTEDISSPKLQIVCVEIPYLLLEHKMNKMKTVYVLEASKVAEMSRLFK